MVHITQLGLLCSSRKDSDCVQSETVYLSKQAVRRAEREQGGVETRLGMNSGMEAKPRAGTVTVQPVSTKSEKEDDEDFLPLFPFSARFCLKL